MRFALIIVSIQISTERGKKKKKKKDQKKN